ncbi:MAG: hypothetical protein CMG00_02575 [Candidatus Marinimicrobia bacterium]|nr:hypothetical protein [Candidatus Neomarinimicrobiota bacterium]|tara:strand:+ start:1925 stop:3052 length:1128 start_codon:yes stop_codon:yes gene_type:complete
MIDLDKYRKIYSQKRNYSVGVEEELMICSPNTGSLINKANEIMESVPDRERYSYELLLSEIETNTPVCRDASEAIVFLSNQRNELRKIGLKEGFKIGISGTHPKAMSLDQKFVSNDSYNWVSDQLRYYAKRNITFSTHVHVSVDNPDRAIKITNATRRWIPALLAISTNSPFFEGVNTGFKSSRSMQFGAFPRTNIPVKIDSFESYISLVNQLIKTKSIEKSRQIWWKIRPHLDYGTIEYRICDVQRSLKKTKMIVALTQALVHSYDQKVRINKNIEDMNYEILNDAFWKSTRFGFNSKLTDCYDGQILLLKDYVYKMLESIRSSLEEFGNLDVISSVEDILTNGTEADEQLSFEKAHGIDNLSKFLMDNVDYNY